MAPKIFKKFRQETRDQRVEAARRARVEYMATHGGSDEGFKPPRYTVFKRGTVRATRYAAEPVDPTPGKHRFLRGTAVTLGTALVFGAAGYGARQLNDLPGEQNAKRTNQTAEQPTDIDRETGAMKPAFESDEAAREEVTAFLVDNGITLEYAISKAIALNPYIPGESIESSAPTDLRKVLDSVIEPVAYVIQDQKVDINEFGQVSLYGQAVAEGVVQKDAAGRVTGWAWQKIEPKTVHVVSPYRFAFKEVAGRINLVVADVLTSAASGGRMSGMPAPVAATNNNLGRMGGSAARSNPANFAENAPSGVLVMPTALEVRDGVTYVDPGYYGFVHVRGHGPLVQDNGQIDPSAILRFHPNGEQNMPLLASGARAREAAGMNREAANADAFDELVGQYLEGHTLEPVTPNGLRLEQSALSADAVIDNAFFREPAQSPAVATRALPRPEEIPRFNYDGPYGNSRAPQRDTGVDLI